MRSLSALWAFLFSAAAFSLSTIPPSEMPANRAFPQGPNWQPATLGGDNAVVPAAATAPRRPPRRALARRGAVRQPVPRAVAAGRPTPGARDLGQRHAAGRSRPSLAGIRHQPVHGSRHYHQTARAGDHRLDPPRDGLRGMAQRAVRLPQRHAADLAGLPHAADAGRRGRHRRSLRLQRGRDADLQPPHRHGRQSQLAGDRPSPLAAHPRADAGANAWLLSKEDAAVLLNALQRRGDYHEHSSPHLLINNGQASVISAQRGRAFVRDVNPRPDAWQGYDNLPGQIDEGFSMEFQPLLSTDRRSVDAMIKCQIDQVEKLVPVMLEVPTQASPRQRAKVEVPQVSNFRFGEPSAGPSIRCWCWNGHGGLAGACRIHAHYRRRPAAAAQLAATCRFAGNHREQRPAVRNARRGPCGHAGGNAKTVRVPSPSGRGLG